MTKLQNTDKHFSDILPPALVKDWRQCFRSRSTLALFILLEVLGWLLLFSTAADRDGTPSAYLRSMENLGEQLYALGVVALCLVIPFRAGSTVAADTRARGSNFLMLTPLSARSIAWGTWSSGALMVLLAAAIASPLLVVRPAMIAAYPYAGSLDVATFPWKDLIHDGLVLFWLVLVGWAMTAFYMFTASLPRFMRVCLLVFCIIMGLATMDIDRELEKLFGFSHGLPDLLLLLLRVVDLGLLLVLFLEFARRHYAAPAENCSRSVRLLAPLPLLIYGGMLLWGYVSGHGHDDTLGQGVFALIYLYTALLFDALLPIYAMPAHAYKLWPVVPGWLQKPGFVPSALCCALGTLLVCIPGFVSIYAPGLHDLSEYSINNIKEMGLDRAALNEGIFALNFGWSALLWLLLTDCFCRRSAGKRPVVYGVVALACCFAAGCLTMPLSGRVAESLLPLAGCNLPYSFKHSAPLGEVTLSLILNGGAFVLMLLLLVAWRGRVKKA